MRRAVDKAVPRRGHLEHERVPAAERVGVGVSTRAVGTGRPSQGVRAVDGPDAVPAEQRAGDAPTRSSAPESDISPRAPPRAFIPTSGNAPSATGATVATSSSVSGRSTSTTIPPSSPAYHCSLCARSGPVGRADHEVGAAFDRRRWGSGRDRDPGRRRRGHLEHRIELLERVDREHVEEPQAAARGDALEVGDEPWHRGLRGSQVGSQQRREIGVDEPVAAGVPPRELDRARMAVGERRCRS